MMLCQRRGRRLIFERHGASLIPQRGVGDERCTSQTGSASGAASVRARARMRADEDEVRESQCRMRGCSKRMKRRAAPAGTGKATLARLQLPTSKYR